MKTKLKIMKGKPPISDDEIKSFMNFEKLIQKHDGVVKAKLKRFYLFQGSALLVVIALVWGVLLYFKTENKREVIDSIQTSSPKAKETVPVPGLRKSNPTEPEPVVEQKKFKSDNSSGENEFGKVVKDEKPAETSHTDKTSYQPVYEQAEPVDGYQSLYEYFSRTLVYPSAGLKDSIQGVVTVVVTINKSGKPEKIKTENSLGKPFDDEAVRVIESMPPWKPALLDGKPVVSTISIPLTFQLKKMKGK